MSGVLKRFNVIDFLILVSIVGIFVAIFFPRLVRARIAANEAEAIHDVRAVVSASRVFSEVNCGLFVDDLANLSKGNIKVPGYPPSAPPFLTEDLAVSGTHVKSGYYRTYQPISADERAVGRCASPAFRTFCYTADPEHPGRTGVRSFVGTAAGDIYVHVGGMRIWCNDKGKPMPADVKLLSN